ncbi:S-layer homology domain-containing protein [Alteribacillus bidgolensis]|uniref:S-layer homology domain-containing protein n=1 Tax=Alteribacillus bidgolensis TaxID=930129 RepID=A0A1G8PL52_9BACI|nr:S-layer homology domain-containing protein [Alteribacillus bidgolensis]SDI93224.1 S-layer homology domain-containing protein [Alteribacillus bidgolensis]
MIIGRTLEADVQQQNEHHFLDVSAETSGSDYIHTLTNEGIFAKSDHFHPQNPLTRAQMAKIVVLAFELDGSSNKTFDDVGTDHWAADYINTLVAAGITTGTSDKTYSPNDSINRGQMAVFINRTLDYLEEQPTGGGLEIDDIIID